MVEFLRAFGRRSRRRNWLDQSIAGFGDQNPIAISSVYGTYASDVAASEVSPTLLRIVGGLMNATSGNASRHIYRKDYQIDISRGINATIQATFATGGSTLFTFLDLNFYVPELNTNKTAKKVARVGFAANAYTLSWIENGVTILTSGAIVGGTFNTGSGILSCNLTPSGSVFVGFVASGTFIPSTPFTINNSISGSMSALPSASPNNVRAGFSGNPSANTSIGFARYTITQN